MAGKRTVTIQRRDAERLANIVGGLTAARVGNAADYKWLAKFTQSIDDYFDSRDEPSTIPYTPYGERP